MLTKKIDANGLVFRAGYQVIPKKQRMSCRKLIIFVLRVDLIVATRPCQGTKVYQDDLVAGIAAPPDFFWTLTGFELVILNPQPVDLNFPSSKQ